MTQTVTATYTGGVLRPATPLPLAEGETVQITVTKSGPATPAPQTEQEAIQRLQDARTLEEFFAAVNAGAVFEPDDGYELRKALNENRRLSGDFRMLYPEDDKRESRE